MELTALSPIAGLAVTDGNIIVGNGTRWVAESGNTARTSLGLGTGDSPTFVALTVTGGYWTAGGTLGATLKLATGPGTVGAPSIGFIGDADTGLWASAPNTLNISTLGVERFEIDASEATFTVPISTTGTINGLGIAAAASHVEFALPTAGSLVFDDPVPGSLWTLSDAVIGGIGISVSANCDLDQNLATAANVTHNNITSTGKLVVTGDPSSATTGLWIGNVAAGSNSYSVLIEDGFPGIKMTAARVSSGAVADFFHGYLKDTDTEVSTDAFNMGFVGSCNPNPPSISYGYIGIHGHTTWNDNIIRFYPDLHIETFGDLNVDGAIASAVSTIHPSGTVDDTDVSGINILFIAADGANNAILTGLDGGVEGQYLHIAIIDHTKTITLKHVNGASVQDFYLHDDVDETLDCHGGWTLVCDGTNWYDCSHAKHV